jgi:hypothetical protein
MNVSVLSTGRCGSTTFARACGHIENYSAGHETQTAKLEGRVRCPPRHIEVDNRLSWLLGRLDDRYGDDAFYVHLVRDPEAVARSFADRHEVGIIRAYKQGIILGDPGEVDPTKMCRHYVETVNKNIRLFLKDKTQCMDVRLEQAREDFRDFWERICAEGSLQHALGEWDSKYNASSPAHDPEAANSEGRNAGVGNPLPVRVWKKMGRVVRKMPEFLREA